jgi:hypothetical protein
MLLDYTHRPWIVVTLLLAAGAGAAYALDPQAVALGRGGGTIVGLTLGSVAYAIMLFCAGLSSKRRLPHWRLGRAQTWLRGHIWLGLLSVWLVALHGAFALGGPLTTALWMLLAAVSLSGVFGLILQQWVPRLLLHSVPGETVAQQLTRQLAYADERLKETVVEFAGSIDSPAPAWDPAAAGGGAAAAAGAAPAADLTKPPHGGEPLRRFYHDYVVPFIEGQRRSPLAIAGRSESLYVSLRTMTPVHIHPGIDEVRGLVTRRRLLMKQRGLMKVLYSWLFVHVPLSWGLLALTAFHAVYALRYLQW